MIPRPPRSTVSPHQTLVRYFAPARQVLINVQRRTGGPRKILNICEVTGMEGDVITMQDIFGFEQTGLSSEGKPIGQFSASGIRPSFLERLKSGGCELDPTMFERKVLLHDDGMTH